MRRGGGEEEEVITGDWERGGDSAPGYLCRVREQGNLLQ